MADCPSLTLVARWPYEGAIITSRSRVLEALGPVMVGPFILGLFFSGLLDNKVMYQRGESLYDT